MNFSTNRKGMRGLQAGTGPGLIFKFQKLYFLNEALKLLFKRTNHVFNLSHATCWHRVFSVQCRPCAGADCAEGSGRFPRTDVPVPATGVAVEDEPPAFVVRGAISNSQVDTELPDLTGKEIAPGWPCCGDRWRCSEVPVGTKASVYSE